MLAFVPLKILDKKEEWIMNLRFVIYIYILLVFCVFSFGDTFDLNKTKADKTDDRFFVGGQVGLGKISFDQVLNVTSTVDSIYSESGPTSTSASSSTGSMGLLGGYKHFIKENMALRYYGQLNYIVSISNFDDLTNINIGANADVIYNFLSLSVEELGFVEFGGFVGLGFGATIYNGKYPQANSGLVRVGGHKINKAGLDVALNLGVTSVIDKQHGVELALRLPFVSHTILDGTQTSVDSLFNMQITSDMYIKMKAKEKYNFNFRYVFYF